MKNSMKYRLLCNVAFIVIFLMIFAILHFSTSFSFSLKNVIAIVVALILSPKVKTYKTQTGKKRQIKWLHIVKNITE